MHAVCIFLLAVLPFIPPFYSLKSFRPLLCLTMLAYPYREELVLLELVGQVGRGCTVNRPLGSTIAHLGVYTLLQYTACSSLSVLSTNSSEARPAGLVGNSLLTSRYRFKEGPLTSYRQIGELCRPVHKHLLDNRSCAYKSSNH